MPFSSWAYHHQPHGNIQTLIVIRFSAEVLEEPIVNEPFPCAPMAYRLDTFLECFADLRTGTLEEVVTETKLWNCADKVRGGRYQEP
jgi:hypothetical protein